MKPEFQRISAEGGVTALLGATAGFFISQSSLLDAENAVEGWRAGAFLAIYTMIFAAVPLAMSARKLSGFRAFGQFFIAAAIIFICYLQILPDLITFTASSDGNGSWKIKDSFAIPLLVAPMIWGCVHVFDVAMEYLVQKTSSADQ